MSEEPPKVVRLPLQIGAAALRNAVVGGGLIVPGFFLLGWVFSLGSYVWLVGIVGFALAAFALQCLHLAWRERPSDLLITPETIRVEGGPHHGFQVERSQIERASVREDLRGAGTGASLEIVLADGSARILAYGDGPGERGAIVDLRDRLLERATGASVPEPPSARATTRRAVLVLLSSAAGWPLTGVLYASIDHQRVASVKVLAALAMLPLLLWAGGYCLVRVWMVDRRASDSALEARRAERRTWQRLSLASLPLLVIPFLVGKALAGRTSDVSPMPGTHGFEATPSVAPSVKPANGRTSIRGSTLFFDGQPIVTTEPGITIESASVDPSGKRVAYIRIDAAGQRSARVSFTDRGERKDVDAPTISDEADAVLWSPTKQQLVYATWKKPVHIGVVATPFIKDAPAANSGFGAEKPVTREGEWATGPAWSPDGAQLAYISYGGGRFGIHEIYVVDSSFEKPARQLTQGDPDCTELDWAADGWIWFSAQGRRQRVKP